MPRRENPYGAMVEGLSAAQFADLSCALAARRCREEVGFWTFDEAANAHKPAPRCPWYHHEHNSRDSSHYSERSPLSPLRLPRALGFSTMNCLRIP